MSLHELLKGLTPPVIWNVARGVRARTEKAEILNAARRMRKSLQGHGRFVEPGANAGVNNRAREYVTYGRHRIEGWFNRINAELFYVLLSAQSTQGWAGALAEIGLHHGKSFIALCLLMQDNERAYGIDVFEQQDLNRDRSGKGDRAILENNLRRWGIDRTSIILDARSSVLVTTEDILSSVGGVRFFSIDGGHWRDIVHCDLSLAERTLLKYGVIALDDCFNPVWPDVSRAYFDWHNQRSKPLVPFAIGPNKLYLCEAELLSFYGEVLDTCAALRPHFTKKYEFMEHEIPIYRGPASSRLNRYGPRAWR